MRGYEHPENPYPYPISREKVVGKEFVVLHRMGDPCYVRKDRVSYIGPMLGVRTSYCVIDGCPLIIDESVSEVIDALNKEV